MDKHRYARACAEGETVNARNASCRPRMAERAKCAMVAVALGLVVLGAPVASAAAAPTARVPVIVCPTGVGVTNPQKPVASSAVVPASAAHLVVYSATSGYIQILGPRNFACQAGIGADGSGTITAAPAGSYNLSLGHGGVAAVAYPTCVGCLLSLACPFFPAAAKAAQQDGYDCPAQPLSQVKYRLSADAVAFSDPPGEFVSAHTESLVPSDSPYPSNGVVIYGTYLYGGRYHDATAMEAVCVLPPSEHATCSAVLNEFLATQVRKFLP